LSRRTIALVALTALFAQACSLRHLAADRLGDALAGGGNVFASDDDPELVGDALPFSLKLMESVLAERPDHAPLLLAAARGFTQYTYGWVQQPRGGESDARARRLYIRARNYGLRGFEVRHPGFEAALRRDAAGAVALLTRDDVPLLYWTASAWALAISLSKDDPESVADLPLAGAMIDRALALDETYEDGAIHGFLIGYEPNRAGASGDPVARSHAHFKRAVELSRGAAASPYVTYAETISVSAQNDAEFRSMLRDALAVKPDAVPAWRLENEIAQRRARWLLAHEEELFLNLPKGEHP
jgi:predicted anti-sigma-YlaC factor YlaD